MLHGLFERVLNKRLIVNEIRSTRTSWRILKSSQEHYISLQCIDHHKINEIVMPSSYVVQHIVLHFIIEANAFPTQCFSIVLLQKSWKSFKNS